MTSRLMAAVKNNSPAFGGLFGRYQKESPPPAGHSRTHQERPSSETDSETAAPPAVSAPAAPVFAVLGAKGGVGASTIAVNLAAAAAKSGISTTLVDAKMQVPDIANLIGCEASHSLLELISRGADVDRILYQACRMESLSGCPEFGVLLPPSDGEAFLSSNLTELSQCLSRISTFDSLFLVDVPGHLDKHLVTLLDQCEKIVLVSEATISGVAASRRWLQTFAELGYPGDRMVVVFNRTGSKFKLVEEQLGTCFADRQVWKVPNASSLLWDCARQGTPIVMSRAGSNYGRAITKLSGDLFQILQKR